MLSPPPPILSRTLKPNPEPSQGTLDYMVEHVPEDSSSQDPTYKSKSKVSQSTKLKALWKNKHTTTHAGAGSSGGVAAPGEGEVSVMSDHDMRLWT